MQTKDCNIPTIPSNKNHIPALGVPLGKNREEAGGGGMGGGDGEEREKKSGEKRSVFVSFSTLTYS